VGGNVTGNIELQRRRLRSRSRTLSAKWRENQEYIRKFIFTGSSIDAHLVSRISLSLSLSFSNSPGEKRLRVSEIISRASQAHSEKRPEQLLSFDVAEIFLAQLRRF